MVIPYSYFVGALTCQLIVIAKWPSFYTPDEDDHQLFITMAMYMYFVFSLYT